MDNDMKRHVAMLMALLRRGLCGPEACHPLFDGAGEADWQACYQLACRQGVMAIAWDGVVTLPPTQQPPRALKLTWAMAVERNEERYARYCHTVHQLTTLLRPHGIGLMQLKGVGLSSYYPTPSHREGGDIDIRLYPLDPSSMSQEEAIAKAERLMEEQGIEVDRAHSQKHNCFRYQGIMIENHKSFLNVYNTREALPMEEFLHQHATPVEVHLLGGKCPVSIPSTPFNAVFIGFHAAQHYGSGLSLHHLCDWACLLRHGAWEQLPLQLMTPKVKHFYQALTGLAQQHLGITTAVPYDEAQAHEILFEMTASRYSSAVTAASLGNNPLRIFAYKWKRLYHGSQLRNQVFNSNFTNRLWTAFKNNYWRPARLFRVTWK